MISTTSVVNILAMLKTRDSAHREETNEIFDKISPVLEGISSFVNVSIARITWMSIEKYGNNILITGSIDPTPSERVRNPSVDSVSLQISLPPKLIDFGTADQVLEFLQEVEKAKTDGDDNAYDILSNNLEYSTRILSDLESNIDDPTLPDGSKGVVH